jgi:hypothetical protein
MYFWNAGASRLALPHCARSASFALLDVVRLGPFRVARTTLNEMSYEITQTLPMFCLIRYRRVLYLIYNTNNYTN